MEKTLVIVKPDGVGKKNIGAVISRFEKEDLKLLAMKMMLPTNKEIECFYDIHKGKLFFEPLVNFMLSGPLVVTVWEGRNSIKRVRDIIGNTNPFDASEGTLRKLFGTDNRRNLVHASDSPDNAEEEIAFFFNAGEILDYNPETWKSK